MEVKTNGFVKVSHSGILSRPEMDKNTDVIVVGAGVAGAALAYTLGKVCIFPFLFLSWCLIIQFVFLIPNMCFSCLASLSLSFQISLGECVLVEKYFLLAEKTKGFYLFIFL